MRSIPLGLVGFSKCKGLFLLCSSGKSIYSGPSIEKTLLCVSGFIEQHTITDF